MTSEGDSFTKIDQVNFDARTLDPMSLVLSGSMVSGVAEISLQYPSSPLDQRFVLIRGDMVGGIEFGAKEETLTLSVGDARGSVDRIVPEAITSKEGFSIYQTIKLAYASPLLSQRFNLFLQFD